MSVTETERDAAFGHTPSLCEAVRLWAFPHTRTKLTLTGVPVF